MIFDARHTDCNSATSMRQVIASFELCCSLAQLLKPTSIYVYIYFAFTPDLGIYTVADRNDFGDLTAHRDGPHTADGKNVRETKSQRQFYCNPPLYLHDCYYFRILCIYYCFTVLYRVSRFLRSRRETLAGNDRSKFNFSPYPLFFFFFFFLHRLRSLSCISPE